MKTDKLNLGQLMRYGFCGFFLCLAFVYGKGGSAELKTFFSKNESNEALLAAAFFASGAVFYSFYRAIVYPLLGRVAILTVYHLDDTLWEHNRSDRRLREPGRWILTAQLLLLLLPVALTSLLILTLPRATYFSLCFQALAFLGSIALTAACFIVLIVALVPPETPLWLKYFSKVSLIKTPKKELQLNMERWKSKQSKEGAQHLEEWASQIHLLYTTALSLALGSLTGAVWECIHQQSWADVQCSIPGALVIILLLLAAFASDCRRRHLEDHLRQHPLRMKRRAPR